MTFITGRVDVCPIMSLRLLASLLCTKIQMERRGVNNDYSPCIFFISVSSSTNELMDMRINASSRIISLI